MRRAMRTSPRSGPECSPAGSYRSSQERRIALYFTGRKHAGENLADVLKQRAAGLDAPIQMCDALSRNVPKFPRNWKSSSGNCLRTCSAPLCGGDAELSRRSAGSCWKALGEVYGYDEAARAQGMSPEQRLHFHQEHSGPVMEKLHIWLSAQFDERKVEPNSGLGTAISYLLKHWERLTLFLRQAGSAAG